MKFILTITLFCLSQIGFSQKDQIEKFYRDIFHDSTVYTLKDYQRDSIKQMNEIQASPFLLSVFGEDPRPLLAEYKCKIDTTQSKFRIINHCGAYHFERLVVSEHFLSFHENKNLKVLGETGDFLKKIQKDSNFTEPITQDEIDHYYSEFKRLTFRKLDVDFEVVTDSEFNKLVKPETDYNWKDYYEKYESPLVEISIPYMNESKDYAYFEYWVTFRRLGGYHYQGIYKKINGKWKAVYVVKIGVS